MKTRSFNLRSLLIGGLCLCMFSAHRPATYTIKKRNMEDYHKVMDYIFEQVCRPMHLQLTPDAKPRPKELFSRCPSGYHPQITSKADSVTTDRYVSGKILYFRGCGSSEVCIFKVCMDKGFVVVRSKNSSEYMSVSKWIALKNQAVKTQVKA